MRSRVTIGMMKNLKFLFVVGIILAAAVAFAVYKILDSDNVGDAPFYITTMTHMESAFKDDKDEALFNKHVDDIRWAMKLFDEYGAKLTIESEKPFASANIKWGLNFFKEILGAGHGVGSHADFGYSKDGKNLESTESLAKKLKELKTLIDGLAGAENNLGVSGGIGQADWVAAAARAGFKYKDGLVGIAYLSF